MKFIQIYFSRVFKKKKKKSQITEKVLKKKKFQITEILCLYFHLFLNIHISKNLVHAFSKRLSFDRNHDEQIWIALNQHSLIKAEANSLAEVFEYYVQLARSMVVDDNANSSQIKTLVLSLTSCRADLMQLIEDSSSVLHSSVQSTIAAHDQQVKQTSLQIAEEQLEYLCSLCRLLASQTNLSLVRDQLKSLDLRVGDSLDRLNEIHSSHDDISVRSFSNLNNSMQKSRKNVRDEYIVDLSSLKSDRFIKAK